MALFMWSRQQHLTASTGDPETLELQQNYNIWRLLINLYNPCWISVPTMVSVLVSLAKANPSDTSTVTLTCRSRAKSMAQSCPQSFSTGPYRKQFYSAKLRATSDTISWPIPKSQLSSQIRWHIFVLPGRVWDFVVGTMTYHDKLCRLTLLTLLLW